MLRNLKKEPKSFAELFESLTQKSLSRTPKRLLETGLITRNATSEYISYFRTKNCQKSRSHQPRKESTKVFLTPAYPFTNYPKVGTNIRRTYKHLRKLHRRSLVFKRKKPRIYILTYNGIKLADFLEETAKLSLDASNASEYMVKRSKKPKPIFHP